MTIAIEFITPFIVASLVSLGFFIKMIFNLNKAIAVFKTQLTDIENNQIEFEKCLEKQNNRCNGHIEGFQNMRTKVEIQENYYNATIDKLHSTFEQMSKNHYELTIISSRILGIEEKLLKLDVGQNEINKTLLDFHKKTTEHELKIKMLDEG